MRTTITIDKSEVFDEVRKQATYQADKAGGDAEFDNISMIPENIDFSRYGCDKVLKDVVNMLAEYIPYDEKAVTDDDTYTIPLDMPDNWPATEESNISLGINHAMVDTILKEWYAQTLPSKVEEMTNKLVTDLAAIYHSACRRMRPRREHAKLEDRKPTVTIE